MFSCRHRTLLATHGSSFATREDGLIGLRAEAGKNLFKLDVVEAGELHVERAGVEFHKVVLELLVIHLGHTRELVVCHHVREFLLVTLVFLEVHRNFCPAALDVRENLSVSLRDVTGSIRHCYRTPTTRIGQNRCK